MLASVPRHWQTIGLPGVLERPSATYWPLTLDAMPPISRPFDGKLAWLLATPSHLGSLAESEADSPATRADAQGLRTLGLSSIPSSFRRLVEDSEPRRHIRSATACYLDLGQFVVGSSDGGSLVHFLSDQQWVLHWLLYRAPDGSECVVVSGEPFGFDDGETDPVREVDAEAPRDGKAR